MVGLVGRRDVCCWCSVVAGAVVHGLLGLLLVCHVAHQHFALQCLDHVLLLVHRLVRPLDLQTAKFVLVVLLFRILVSAINLHPIQKQTLSPTVSIRHSAMAVISHQKFKRLCQMPYQDSVRMMMKLTSASSSFLIRSSSLFSL